MARSESYMGENESKQFPTFESLDELVEFVETHSLADYWDSMPEAHFEMEAKRSKYLVAIDGELSRKLQEIAQQRHTSTEALVDSWLREKVEQAS